MTSPASTAVVGELVSQYLSDGRSVDEGLLDSLSTDVLGSLSKERVLEIFHRSVEYISAEGELSESEAAYRARVAVVLAMTSRVDGVAAASSIFDGGAAQLPLLFRVAEGATRALREIAGGPTPEEDDPSIREEDVDDGSFMLDLARVRLGILQCLAALADRRERVVRMMEQGVASVCLEHMLHCGTSSFDIDGQRAACELLRNLCIPIDATGAELAACGAVRALATAATGGCRDVNGAAAAAAALRMLVAGHRRASIDFAGAVERIVGIELTTTHPFVRAELARALALSLPGLASRALSEGAEDPVLEALRVAGSKDGVEFVSFLFASRHAQLHNEGALALAAVRRVHQGKPEAVPASPLDVGALVCEDKPLRSRLQEIAEAGSAGGGAIIRKLLEET